MSTEVKSRAILYAVFFIFMGLILYLMILKEKSDAADRINAFNNNEVLFCNELIVSKENNWILLNDTTLVRDENYVKLYNCSIK